MKKFSILFAAILFVATSFAQYNSMSLKQHFTNDPVVIGNKAPVSKVVYDKNGKGTFWYNLEEAITNYWGQELERGGVPTQCDTLNLVKFSDATIPAQVCSFGQVFNWPATSWEELYVGQPIYDGVQIPFLGENRYTVDSVMMCLGYNRGTQVPDSVVDTLIISYIVNLETEKACYTFSDMDGNQLFSSYMFPYNLKTFRATKTFENSQVNLSADSKFYYDTVLFTVKDSSQYFQYLTFAAPKELKNIASPVLAITATYIPGVNERTTTDTVGVTLNRFSVLSFKEPRTAYNSNGSMELLTDCNTSVYSSNESFKEKSNWAKMYTPANFWSHNPKYIMGVHAICEDCPIVNIEDPEEQTINVYPNPASSNLKVNFEGEANIQLFNLVGQMVYSTTATDNATINVSNLRSGVYMLKVNDKTVKVVVR